MSANAHQTLEERAAHGKALRKLTRRSSHGHWVPSTDRPDPVDLLEEQNGNRLQWLVPVRRWRMSRSPFTFFRGSAKVMASDLAATPVSGLTVQACGDAHLANFGLYASPERQLVFDLNDFDETLAGPWEWDVKRLAASFHIAGRHNRLGRSERHRVTARVVRAYREAMTGFAGMRTLDIWYSFMDANRFVETAGKEGRLGHAAKIANKAQTKDSLHALDRLAEEVEGEYRIKSEPPGLVPLRELREEFELQGRNLMAFAKSSLKDYLETIPDHCKRLFDRFTPVDVALKVVGVGSVGTRCGIMLLEGQDRHDPLFLQIKQANRSVLEKHLPKSPYRNQGQRVVEGQRLMQSVSDIFLGWTRSKETGAYYYWRQLRDWKGSVDVENMNSGDLYYHARLCGWTLARAHACSGDHVAIASYLGASDSFDQAIVQFARAYADQNEADYASFVSRIEGGHLAAEEG